MVDHFKEHGAWELSNFPPPSREALMEWLNKTTWDGSVHDDLKVVKEHMEARGADKFCVAGFCWGGKIAVLSGALDWVSATASAHPSFVTPEDVAALKVPMAFCLTKDEPDYTPMEEAAKGKSFDCIFKKYPEMHHGFCTARGDFSNDANRKACDDALNIMVDLFDKNTK